MAIVNFSTDNPTPQERLVNQADSLKGEMARQFESTYKMFTKVVEFVWDNPDFTPQQALDAFGPDAAELFKLSAAVMAMLHVLGHDVEVVPPGVNVTANTDGTVTLS